MANQMTSGPPSRQLRLLVLGGTRFVGRALVGSALARGHHVTLFNRGRSNPELFNDQLGVEKIRGDRTRDLTPLAGRHWDAVVDVAAYYPDDVARSVDALAPSTDRYLFVSTISVYADCSVPPVEGAPVATLTDPSDQSPASYGARKAVCEQVVESTFGGRATVVRPGLIVGPFDPTDRFGYWPRRIAAGGTVLAPGHPDDPLQFIDVRDLADFIVLLLEEDRPGTFNATGRPIGFGSFLEACQRACDSYVKLVWVPSEQLLKAGLDPWMGVPLWIGAPEMKAANLVNTDRAVSAGLRSRPLEDTIRASLDSPSPPVISDFTPEREQQLLAGPTS